MAELHVGEGQAYSTIASAVAEHLAGDIIIVHEGTYTLSGTITIKAGSSLTTPDGETATINALSSGTSIYVSAGSIIDDGLTITNSASTGTAITLNVAGTAYIKCQIYNHKGRPFSVSNASGIIVFTGKLKKVGAIDCSTGNIKIIFSYLDRVNNDRSVDRAIRASGGTVEIYHSYCIGFESRCFVCTAGSFTVKNTVISGPGGTLKYPTYAVMERSGGTAEVSDCVISGHALRDIALFGGTVTNNNNVISELPLINYGYGRAAFTFFAVDSNHISNGSLMGYANALSSVGAKMSYFPDDHDHLTEDQKAILRSYYALGHDLGCEGNSSSPLDYNSPINVSYVGIDANPKLIISGNGGTLVVSTDSGPVITISLDEVVIGSTTISNSLVKNLNDHADIVCEVYDHGTGDYDDAYAYCLADGEYVLSASPVDILWDMDRYLNEEIVIAAQNMASIIGNGYSPVSYMMARYRNAPLAEPFLASAGFISALSTTNAQSYIGYIGKYAVSLGLNTSGLFFGDGTEASARKRARDWAAYAMPIGVWDGYILGEAGATPTDPIKWFADELIKCGVVVVGLSEGYEYMTDESIIIGNNKTLNTSPCIDVGTWITGVNDTGEADPWGNYVHRLPNIGADQGAGSPGSIQIVFRRQE